MRKSLVLSVLGLWLIVSAGLFAAAQREAAAAEEEYPAGTMRFMGYGNPQVHEEYIDAFLDRNRDIAPNVRYETIHVESEAAARQQIIVSATAGAWDDLPTAFRTQEVSMQVMAEAGLLMDLTDFVTEHKERFIDGAFSGLTYDGRYYAFPSQLKPQLVFYNVEIFDEYGIDPERMDTIEGWVEVGRELKERSNGEVYLSYIDPGSYTWRYYGRRGFMPQANARIWDDEGNVVIDTDPGARMAFETLDTLYQEELLLRAPMFQPSLYDATRDGRIATYYIGAFWDQFLRQNLPDMEGKWRMMTAPMFESVGTRGAPVVALESLPNPPGGNTYAGLYLEYLLDFQTNIDARIAWTESMLEQGQTVSAPITHEALEDPYWRSPTPYYGGQSLLGMESDGLHNPSENLRVTTADAEADAIISAELEAYVAGDQTMEQAIANMGRVLRDRIGQAPPAR